MAALQILSSRRPFAETLQALVDALQSRGMTVFARIDHAAGAAEAGLPLGPTTVVLFGAARAGTPLMQVRQTLGLDLPLRALVYETPAGEVRVAYREPALVLAGQGLDPDGFPQTAAMSALLAAVAAEACGAQAG